MRRKTVLLLLAALAVAAAAAGGALSATTSVKITTPKTNQKVALHQTSYLAVAGTAAYAAAAPATTHPTTGLHGADVQALDRGVNTHGPNVYSGFVALSGASWFDLPSYTASVNKAVQISADDPTFSNPTPARLSGSNWSVAIPTPSVGKHTIYAKSTQGYSTSAPTSVTITVTK